MVALVLGPGLQAGKVGARTGFRVTLAPARVAANNFGDMLALLFFVAKLQQRGAKHPDTQVVERRAAAQRFHFFAQDFGLTLVKTATTVFGRPVRHRPALVGHALEPQSGIVAGEGFIASGPNLLVAGNRLTL